MYFVDRYKEFKDLKEEELYDFIMTDHEISLYDYYNKLDCDGFYNIIDNKENYARGKIYDLLLQKVFNMEKLLDMLNERINEPQNHNDSDVEMYKKCFIQTIKAMRVSIRNSSKENNKERIRFIKENENLKSMDFHYKVELSLLSREFDKEFSLDEIIARK